MTDLRPESGPQTAADSSPVLPVDIGLDAATARTPPGLGQRVRHGLAWSGLSSLSLRLGSLLTGIALARLLSPQEFGIYAVALTAQTVLINLSDLGMTADLVREGDLDRRGPTVTTIATAASSLMCLIMFFTAPAVSDFMGSPEATPVVKVLSFVLIFSGLGVVPSADMQRNFLQKKQFAVDGSNFAISTALTIVMAMLGFGPMSLAVGRIAGQLAATALQFWLVHRRPSFGWHSRIAVPALTFGLPLAGANLLSWLLLTVDNAIVGHLTGVVALGLYVLAFNVSSWPMSVIGLAVRAVALPGFTQDLDGGGNTRPRAVWIGTTATATVAFPAGVMLAALAEPIVHFLYGEQWTAAAPALGGLGIFGAMRVVFDVWVAYLIASGATRVVLGIQAIWLIALAPLMYFAVNKFGLIGAGWVHPVVAIAVTLPAYLIAMSRRGISPSRIIRGIAAPAIAAIPAGLVARCASTAPDAAPWLSIVVGGICGLMTYLVLILGCWFLSGAVSLERSTKALGTSLPIPLSPWRLGIRSLKEKS